MNRHGYEWPSSHRRGALLGVCSQGLLWKASRGIVLVLLNACADQSHELPTTPRFAGAPLNAPSAYFDARVDAAGNLASNGYYPQGRDTLVLSTGGRASGNVQGVFGYYTGEYAFSGSVGDASASLTLSGSITMIDAYLRGGTNASRSLTYGGVIRVFVLGPPGTKYKLRRVESYTADAALSNYLGGNMNAGIGGWVFAGVIQPGDAKSDAKAGTVIDSGTTTGPPLPYANATYSLAKVYGVDGYADVTNVAQLDNLVTGHARAGGTLTITVLEPIARPPLNDADGDGVPDAQDLCPGTVPGASVDANGCSHAQRDDDGDGVPNGNDRCTDTPAGTAVDADGCSQSQADSDGDGVPNHADQCPGTPPGVAVNSNGCEEPNSCQLVTARRQQRSNQSDELSPSQLQVSPIPAVCGGEVRIESLTGTFEVRPAGEGQDTMTLLVGVYVDGQPIPHQSVALQLEPVATSGGHAHTTGTKPPGTVNGNVSRLVDTGTSGIAVVAYAAPSVSGTVVITGTSPEQAGARQTITVRVAGLIPLSGLSLYYQLIGVRPEHPDSHFGTPEFNSALTAFAREFYLEFHQPLQVNDMSLEWGGRFDLNSTWRPPHAEHTNGRVADIRNIDLTVSQYNWIVWKWGYTNMKIHYNSPGGPPYNPRDVAHFHLRYFGGVQ